MGNRARRLTQEETGMAQAKNAAQSAKGKVKTTVGKATGNKKLEAKGKADQAKATVKKTVSKAKRKLK